MFTFGKNQQGSVEQEHQEKDTKKVIQNDEGLNMHTSATSATTLDQKIEAILFYKGEEVTLSFLVKILAEKKGRILDAVDVLEKRLEGSAIGILKNKEKFLLVVKKDYSEFIAQLRGEENLGELSPSALETLSIVLYKGPVSKSEIDQIRGVNSSYILRNLLIRGLVERKNVSGKIVYTETFDLMRYLGVVDKKDLPGYEKVVDKLNQIDTSEEEVFEKKSEEGDEENNTK